MTKNSQTIKIQSIFALVLLMCPYFTNTFRFVKSEWANRNVCEWTGFDDETMTAAQKHAFINNKLDTFNDPLDLWYTFKSPKSADFLDIEKLHGEYAPLMYNGKYVSKEFGTLMDRADFTSPKEIVYKSVDKKLVNNICPKKEDSDNKVRCEKETPVCITIIKLKKGDPKDDPTSDPSGGSVVMVPGGLIGHSTGRRLLAQQSGLGLDHAIGVPMKIKMWRCNISERRFDKNTGVLNWQDTKHPWIMEFVHGESWIKMDIYNPFLHENRGEVTIATPCLRAVKAASGDIGPSFMPPFNKRKAKDFLANGPRYCNRLHNSLFKRTAKIAHTLGLTDCNTEVEMTDHGHGYKGIFKAGQRNDACIRFSYGTRPVPGKNPPNTSFALKILRDNKFACDILAMWDFRGQTTTNMFENPMSNNISNPVIQFKSEALGDRFLRIVRSIHITENRPGLLSNHKCALFDGQGNDEQAADPNAAEPFPFGLMFVPNPLLQKLCQTFDNADNPFECFSELSQTTVFTDLWNKNLIKIALVALKDPEFLARFPGQDFSQEESRLMDLKEVDGAHTEADIQDFESIKTVRDQMATMRNQLYKIVAVDQPMYVDEVNADKNAFRCIGYVKRKNTGAFETNYFSDHFMRFSHDFWRVDMFNSPDKRGGKWWGRDETQRDIWARAAFEETFKATEGPKNKYWPAYQNHFVPGLALADTDFAEFVYKRSVDYLKCPTKAEMEGTA